MRVLCVESSANPESRSTAMLKRFCERLGERESALEVVELNLVANPPPIFDEAMWRVYKEPTPEAQAKVAHEIAVERDSAAGPDARVDSRALEYIRQLQWADYILIAAPVYNWGVPAPLKAWVDQVSRIGYTFKTIPTGIEGLLSHTPMDWDAQTAYNGKKRVVIFVSSGMTPAGKITDYLREIFAFFGIRDVHEVGCACLDQTQVPKEALAECDALCAQLSAQ